MKKVWLITICVLTVQFSMSQDSPMRFQSITINDGLSLSSVYCIKKDSKGFMWFGTEDGLNRFDGYHFTIYRTDVNNPNSICYKWIEHIEEDENSCLWFGSRNGLSHFNPKSEKFTNFRKEHVNSIPNDTITCLKSFNSSMLAGTKKGLALFDNGTLACLNYSSIETVNAIHQVNNEVIIAASNGLFKLKADLKLEKISTEYVEDIVIQFPLIYVASKQVVSVINIAKNNSEEGLVKGLKDIESICPGVNNQLWINTRNGLWLKNIKKGWLKKIISTTNTTNSLATNTDKSLWFDGHDKLWYATHGDGLFIVNKHLEVTKCIHNPTDKESVNQNSFNCIYSDSESNNVWLGTYGAGINIYHPAANKFDLIKHNPLNKNSLASNFIWSVIETHDSCLWIGTNDKGLCHYCPKANVYATFEHRPEDKSSLSNNSVRKVFEDSDGTIWVGTDGGGLNRFKVTDLTFTKYKHDKKNEQSISDNSVRVIFEDSKERLWVGTRNGLNLFDKSNGTFKRYQHQAAKPKTISNSFVYASIVESSDGNLWIGTYGGGLNHFNPETEEFKHYTTKGDEGKRLSNNIVFSLHEDVNGLIWVGTNEGLNVLNPLTGEIKVLGMKDGLPNEVIYSILPDGKGNLWMSTNHGICCLNTKKMKCRNFDVSDGLQSNEFNGGAFHKGQSGRMYFGGVYGLNILNPTIIKSNKHVNQPIITRLEVLGNEVGVNAGVTGHHIAMADSQYTMAANISYTQHIELDYSQRFFAIEFSGLNHLFPNKTIYAFQLYPMDKKWNKAGQRNYVSFANVKPGNYEFKVISTNSDGVWGDSVANLRITIHPPFWQRSWFVLIEIILLLILVVFVYRYLIKIRTNKILKLQNQRIKNANERLKQSEDNLRQMNVTKDKFFSIISHDLKNPFTSLMSISNMLDENYYAADEDDRRDGVSRINQSVKSIYLLLENLLTWSRSQRGKITYEQKQFSLTAIINENINLYRNSAAKKNIELISEFTVDVVAYGDRNTIATIVRNLSGNAIKFTPADGQIIYKYKIVDGFIRVGIKDTGVGISADNQLRLFCIDKKLKTDGTEGEKGTGLGLIICKEFVEKNGGEIGFDSEQGKGSEFWFTVKKDNV